MSTTTTKKNLNVKCKRKCRLRRHSVTTVVERRRSQQNTCIFSNRWKSKGVKFRKRTRTRTRRRRRKKKKRRKKNKRKKKRNRRKMRKRKRRKKKRRKIRRTK